MFILEFFGFVFRLRLYDPLETLFAQSEKIPS